MKRVVIVFLVTVFSIFVTLYLLNFRSLVTPTVSPEKVYPAVTLLNIFDNKPFDVRELNPNKLVTILATGDVVPGRSVNWQTTIKNDFTWSWQNTSDFLKQADLTYVNFEVPLVTNCQVVNEGMNFCGDVRQVQGLVTAGVDVANLANNHSGDRGIEGINSTKNILQDSKIDITGTGAILYKTVKGTKFAFLGFNDITSVINPSPAIEENIVSQIKEARQNADVVIVGWHWGVEYTEQPSQRQISLAHLTIDSGADLILGNHPHWIQPIEIYKNKVIMYAHGNFIFDQMWSKKTEESVIGQYTFYGPQLIGVSFMPINIRDYGQPYFLEGSEKDSVLTQLKDNSVLLVSKLP